MAIASAHGLAIGGDRANFRQRLLQQLKQSIVVENRAGAGGNIGVDAVAKSDPDGYTILFTPQGPISIAQRLTPPPPFSAEKDLIPIAMLVWQPVFLVVNKNVPAADLPAFIALAKKQPGKLNFGSAGLGTEMHLTGELLKLESGIDIVHVPYRGGGPAITGLLTGEIEMMVVVTSSIAPHIESGAVKALAATAPSRLKSYPDVRTTKEFGWARSTPCRGGACSRRPALRRQLSRSFRPKRSRSRTTRNISKG